MTANLQPDKRKERSSHEKRSPQLHRMFRALIDGRKWRLLNLALDTATPLRWRDNLGLRGLTALPVLFDQRQRANDGSKRES